MNINRFVAPPPGINDCHVWHWYAQVNSPESGVWCEINNDRINNVNAHSHKSWRLDLVVAVQTY